MNPLINLDKLPFEVKEKVAKFTEELLGIYRENVVSIFVYGSAAGRNFIPGVSDVNISVVFRQLDFQVLKKALKQISRGIHQKISAPLFLTETHIRSSLDVFPMEFLDMKENRIVLYGDDVLKDIEVKAQHLRLFCEQQIKGKLVRIRQAYLEIGLTKKGMEALLKESLRSLMTVFRNLVRLKGKDPGWNNATMLTQLCKEYGLDEEVFLAVYKDKSNDEKIGSHDVEVYMERYIGELEKLGTLVDKL